MCNPVRCTTAGPGGTAAGGTAPQSHLVTEPGEFRWWRCRQVRADFGLPLVCASSVLSVLRDLCLGIYTVTPYK